MMDIIVSDLHIGSRFFLRERFERFLSMLPAGATLVLNGDTIHEPRRSMRREHVATLRMLCDESMRRRVVWLPGNHDGRFRPPEPHRIDVRDHYEVGSNLYVTHGTDFVPFRRLMHIGASVLSLVRFAGEPVASVRVGRRIPTLYAVIRRASMRHAANFARRKGFTTIACGHMHVPCDLDVYGVRYINIGTWTEWPAHFLLVDGEDISLESADRADEVFSQG